MRVNTVLDTVRTARAMRRRARPPSSRPCRRPPVGAMWPCLHPFSGARRGRRAPVLLLQGIGGGVTRRQLARGHLDEPELGPEILVWQQEAQYAREPLEL